MGNAETRDASHGAAAGKPHGGAAGGNYGADRQIKMELDIQKDRMGKLIGTSGQTIKSIQQKVHPVKLNAPTKDDAASDEYKFVAVTLTGKATEVFKACEMVHDVATACLAVLTCSIAPQFVTLLQRPNIQGLKQSIPVDNIFLPRKQDKNPKVVLEGYLEDVIKAYNFMYEEVVKADRELQKARESQKLMQISQRRMGGGAAEAGAAEGAGGGGGRGKENKKGGRGGDWREGGGAPKTSNPPAAQSQAAGAAGAE